MQTAKRSGITPAYAGKSSDRQKCRRAYQDHPRLCGEKFRPILKNLSYLGSPPPMRGKVHEVSAPNGYVGITPAYAGKSNRRKLVARGG